MTGRRTTYECDDCGAQIPCTVCGVHNCAAECGACGGGCMCDCSCPTLRDDAWY